MRRRTFRARRVPRLDALAPPPALASEMSGRLNRTKVIVEKRPASTGPSLWGAVSSSAPRYRSSASSAVFAARQHPGQLDHPFASLFRAPFPFCAIMIRADPGTVIAERQFRPRASRKARPNRDGRSRTGSCACLNGSAGAATSETWKIAAIMVVDVVCYSPARLRRRGSHAGAAWRHPQ